MKKSAKAAVCFAAALICAWGAAAEQLEIIDDVRMRAEPIDSAPVVSVAVKGAVVPLLDEHGSWYKIEFKGAQGWIYNKHAKSARPKAGDIFTKQDASMLPPSAPLDDEEEEADQVKYVQVIKDNTMILEYLDPYAPFLYKANKGDWFVLVYEGPSWCNVVYKDTTGWVRRTSVEILDAQPAKADIVVEQAKTLFIALLALGIVVLVVSGIVTYRHIQADRKRKIYVQKNVLLLAKESKHVQYMLTNSTTTLERCFSEIGFSVNVVKDSVTARNIIEGSMPDLILVDWNFETAILAKIDNLFARMALSAAPHFLFYNVPDPATVPPSKALAHVNLLGITVSDRDIFQVVTPLIVHQAEVEHSSKNTQGLQRCALEGEIAGGNLLEVLQFIEIGSKTGCLMVETRGPFGLIYFGDGRITYAAAKGDNGEPTYGVEGVYAILNQPAGKFRFITNKQPKAANLNLPTLSVLMEWTKNKDEAHR
ncbi:MAG: DUF4388 domain-containing protein [Chitinispirillales bacterium]|nr:DUF4388 domain-containing protein [Chitinispirillales bacterium]